MSVKICKRIEEQHKMQNLNDPLNKDFEEKPENSKKKRKSKASKVKPSKQKRDESDASSSDQKYQVKRRPTGSSDDE